MTKAVLIKTDKGLNPASEEDREALGKVRNGEAITMTFKRTRSLRQHREGFALVRSMFDNQDHFTDQEIFRTWLKMQIGDVDFATGPKGEVIPKVHSWEFGQMPEERFEKTVKRLKDFAWETYGIDYWGEYHSMEQYA